MKLLIRVKKNVTLAAQLVKEQFVLNANGGIPVTGQYQSYLLARENVIISNDHTLVAMGLPSTVPAVMAMKTPMGVSIVVNTAFTNMPESVQKAFIAHERGHIKAGHLDQPLIGAVQMKVKMLKRAFNLDEEQLLQEYQADEYSYSQGYDMIEALHYMRELGVMNDVELNKRITHLRNLV